MAAEQERVIWTGRPSWRGRMAILVPGVLLVAALLAILLWAGVAVATSLIVAAVVAAIVLLWTIWETIRWRYTVTNHRVFVRHGLISIDEQTARLERVQDITLRQSLFDRMFGVGRLLIDTAGSSGEALQFRALVDPARVREVLDTAVRAEQHENAEV